MDSVIPQSFQEEEEEEEEVRNWLELPPDTMSLIFLKLGAIDLVYRAQFVCSTWWKLSKQPHLFRSIHVQKCLIVNNREIDCNEEIVREAVDRSCGQLVEFSAQNNANNKLLKYISQRSSSLRSLRLVLCYFVTDDGLIEMAKELPQLEELEIVYCSFTTSVFETIGRFCPQLKSFRVNFMYYSRGISLDGLALAIAKNMPELRHLNLFGDELTNVGLRAILGGCPHLESLDLRRCFNLNFAGFVKERSANIKVRLPYDSIDDFEYHIECSSDEEFLVW